MGSQPIVDLPVWHERALTVAALRDDPLLISSLNELSQLTRLKL